MKKLLLLLWILPCFGTLLRAAGEVIDVRTFGAIGDGRTLATLPLQRAIDQAHAKGGGTVHVPPGTYRSGTIELRSGVTLDLAAGATIVGSAELADYRRGHWPALLLAKDQQHIAVTGEGTLDGNSQALEKLFEQIRQSGDALSFFPGAVAGQPLDLIGPTGVETRFDPHALQAEGKLMAFVYNAFSRPSEFVRPQIIEFWGCRNVTVRGITLRNAACWVQTYRDCEDVLIERIKVRSTHYWNNDGIDLVDCRRVKVLDCDIDSADDALCLKSDPRGLGCEDITVARCTLASRASALKLGTASHHGFRRIHVSDLKVRDTYRSVVAIQSVDGAVIEDVKVERVRATNTGNAFFIRLGHRTARKPPGAIRGVVLRDIEVEVPPLKPGYHSETGMPHNLIPSPIVGLPRNPIEDVLLENISVRYGGGGDRDHAEVKLDKLDTIPEKAGAYPEFSMWGELPAWAMYIRHADGITLRNIRFTLAAADFRPAIVSEDVAQLKMNGLHVGAGGGEPIIVLKDSPGAELTDAAWPAATREPIRLIPHGAWQPD